MGRWMNLSKKHEIIAGPFKGIKGDVIDYDLITGEIELAIGSEVSIVVYARALQEVEG